MRPRLRPTAVSGTASSRLWKTRQPGSILDRPGRFSTKPPTASTLPAPPVKWLSELQARVGKCIVFGCSPVQISRAAEVVRALAAEWRELTAGSQGFLTGEGRGLEDHKVLWGVMDSFQHVNNVTYLKYAEGSRVNWVTNFARVLDPSNARRWRELMTPTSIGLIMKSIKIDFKLPVTYPDTLSCYTKLREWPPGGGGDESASILLDCVVLSHRHRRAAARLEEEVVTYDYRAAAKTAIPAFARDVFASTWALQLREQARARARILELYGIVERLEAETWNRPDAAEDMGTAGPSSGGR